MLRRKEGFTLIELLIVILIIAILVAIALPLYLNSQKNARLRTCQANIRTLDGAINAYRADFESEPQNGSAGVDDLVDSGYMKKAPKCPTDKSKDYVLTSAADVPLEASCVVSADHTI